MANIFIYGSCVSRDAYGHCFSDHRLLQYVARQSWISAVSKPSVLLKGSDLASNFQNRMLSGDLASNAVPLMRRHAEKIDLLLMDMTDERLGIHTLSDGCSITRSNELVTSKWLDAAGTKPPLIRFGSERFMRQWQRAADTMFTKLTMLRLQDKALVIHTPWATNDDAGNALPERTHLSVSKANEYMSEMAEYAAGIGFKVERMPTELAIAESDHKWGVSPFHFQATAMEWIGERVETELRRK